VARDRICSMSAHSRCYILRDGHQTQPLPRSNDRRGVDRQPGLLTRTDAYRRSGSTVLSSSIGGPQTTPVVTSLRRCGAGGASLSDGLTKHVTDDRIRRTTDDDDVGAPGVRGPGAGRARRGGTDNVTVVVARTVRATSATSAVTPRRSPSFAPAAHPHRRRCAGTLVPLPTAVKSPVSKVSVVFVAGGRQLARLGQVVRRHVGERAVGVDHRVSGAADWVRG